MTDDSVADLLTRLASPDPGAAWNEFLQRYSVTLLQIIRRYESDPQRVSECREHVYQALSDDRFRRLLKFDVQGTAKFRTWLMAVTANLCIDWKRKHERRFRPVRAIAYLPELEQLVYRYIFVRGMPRAECLHALEGRFPGLNEQRLAEINARLFATLTPQHRWQLRTRAPGSGLQADGMTLDLSGDFLQPQDMSDGPDEIAQSDQQRDQLAAALAQLPTQQRLLLRLRYEQDLTLAEVARLTGLPDPFRAKRQIQAALAALAALMSHAADCSGRKRP
jgi:RNA polymerase sigma factor (sigma-70 family)